MSEVAPRNEVMSRQPILGCMVWRGRERFERCLRSIVESRSYFSRVLLSITGSEETQDLHLARAAQAKDPSIEVICTGRELPPMQQQAFWVDYLIDTGAEANDWVFRLAYDDEVRKRGIEAIVDDDSMWPLEPQTAYFGLWALRHQQPYVLWSSDPHEALESWTSFPPDGPTQLPVIQWIRDQLQQPTCMQMSGSVNQRRSFVNLKNLRPRNRGPMRIEMAIASAPQTHFVAEFPEPVSVIYGRSNSDRASYKRAARGEDFHLPVWLLRYGVRQPQTLLPIASALFRSTGQALLWALGIGNRSQEEWRVRGDVVP